MDPQLQVTQREHFFDARNYFRNKRKALELIPRTSARDERSRWPYVLSGVIVSICIVALPLAYLLFARGSTASPVVVIENAGEGNVSEFGYGPEPRLSESSFFLLTLNSFIENKQTFIEADLNAMRIRYFKEGVQVFEAPILTKGKEGSWWETPSGLYAVEAKKETHFSSFGQVNTQWNLVFQGNFFIHGWPTYPDGTEVSTQYSGGCIRLSDTDANQLYLLASEGTPILIHEADFQGDSFSYSIPPPDVDAKSYLIADVENGTILTSYNATSSFPIASLTKLMTAIVASEYINLDKSITVPKSALASTSVARLSAGMKMNGYSYLLPLLLESDNVAANTLASVIGREQFVASMNKKAKSLGLTATHFADPSGLNENNTSSTEDLMRLASYIYHNRSFIFKISTGEDVKTLYNVYPFSNLLNFNPVEGLSGFVGGKVGETNAAKETIISLYNMNIKGEERAIAFVVLGTDDNLKAVEILYNFMKKEYGALPVGTTTRSED